jgi:Apg6 BARA domain
MGDPSAMQVDPSEEDPEVTALKTKLALLKKRRRLVEASRQEHQDLYQRLEEKCHELQHQQELAIHEYRGWKLRHQQANTMLEQSQRWNALNDGFFIWHQGPFATINGVRLGAEAIVSSHTVPAHKTDEAATPTKTTTTTALGSVMGAAVSLPGRYLGFTSTSTTTTTTEPTPSSPSNHISITTNSSDPSSTPTTIRVPWTEINSALGQIVLFLKILESTPHGGISFPHHVLVPQGSTSKIGLRQPNAITGNRGGEVPIVALYHLYSDDSFQLFGKRNFNLALRALTECLATAATGIQARDRTLVLPYAMQVEHDNPSAPCTIGGLPVQYPQQEGVPWTRAMKYLLTNVKWCVAYAAKHVDR